MIPPSEDALPDCVRQWVINAIDPQATVQSSHRLHGGISTTIHSVALQTNQGVRDVVVRQYDNAAWLQEEPDLARHEAESLRWATRTGLPTPQLIAFDETGHACGIPVLLMTKLAGAIVLQPPNVDQWLDALAQSLAQIHAVDADGFPWAYFTYTDLASLKGPSTSRHPDLWQVAINLAQGPRPPVKECFIHRDYHPVNVLWSQNRVSGVVDWPNACRGPAGIDLGHCRVNLVQLFGVPTADAFLSAYQSHAGPTFHYDPYWDILSLLDILDDPPTVYAGWTAFGVTGLTDQLMIERLDAYLISLLQRASGA